MIRHNHRRMEQVFLVVIMKAMLKNQFACFPGERLSRQFSKSHENRHTMLLKMGQPSSVAVIAFKH